MENEQPGASRPRRARTVRRALLASLMGSAVLGGVLVLLPAGEEEAVPAPGAVARARAAVSAGVPAALPDLAAFVADRETYLRNRPGDARAWALLGAAYVERGARTADAGNYPRAERALRTSLKVRGRRNEEALAGLAAPANARRDYRAAKQWGEAAVGAAPKMWTAYPSLIEAYAGLGDYKAQRRTLDRLLALRHGPAATAVAARVYWGQGRHEDATASLTDAVARAGGRAERAAYWVRCGELEWERGEPAEALRYFEAAVRTDSGAHAALAGRGRAPAALGRTSQALEAYRAAFAKQPDPRYPLELGELYASLGDEEAAKEQYDLVRERVRKDEAGGVDDALVLGLLEADHGDPHKAVRRLRKEWKRQPGIPVADALGWALYRAGEGEQALVFATRATDRERGGGVQSALYTYHRAEIELDLKRTGPARRHFVQALRINPHFSPLLAPAAEAALGEAGEPPQETVPTRER
ncbi:tetratricopeptide repeat protein [Streptomyces sp. NPDC001634]|uniref:tetratricopeptide repeat protein n=1 Tax=Streptomyces sp. NPDC001634 TaxID=3154390 RepID=UPI00332BA6F2